MHDVTGNGCSEPGAPNRSDLGLHDFTGGNTFVPDIVATYYPDLLPPEPEPQPEPDSPGCILGLIQQIGRLFKGTE